MADTEPIKQATNSAALRGKITTVLSKLWNESKSAKTLGRLPANKYVSQESFNRHCKVDDVPVYNSNNMVTSGGVFAVLGDLENIGTGGY